ncbi:uncharacterized protein M6B38_396665 [Iris pallida]|uniref:DUF4283 domain-containing protein n=1 Tax=Iris pallida TaxID=29817 RepID=A0AAX6FVZ1_IRIPA|nr:uncharacterized protein M6B38_396665 [Iris pallida]
MAGMQFAGKVYVGVLDGKHLILRPNFEEDFLYIRAKVSWTIAGAPMRIFRWSLYFVTTEESPIAPVWVALPGLPQHLFGKQAIFVVASCVGTPLMLDRATALHSHPGLARVLVEIDISKPRPSWIRIFLPGGKGCGSKFYTRKLLPFVPIASTKAIRFTSARGSPFQREVLQQSNIPTSRRWCKRTTILVRSSSHGMIPWSTSTRKRRTRRGRSGDLTIPSSTTQTSPQVSTSQMRA